MKAYVVSIAPRRCGRQRSCAVTRVTTVPGGPRSPSTSGYAKGSNMENWPTRGGNLSAPTTCSQRAAQCRLTDHGRVVPAAHPVEHAGPTPGPGTPRALRSTPTTRSTRRSKPAAGTVGLPGGCGYGTGWEQVYPQPVLSGISFDIDGYMILGFTDRNAIQSGNRNCAAVSTPTSGRFWECISNGDTLIAAPASLVGTRAGRLPGRDRSELRARVQGPGRQRAAAHRRGRHASQNPTYTNGEGPGGGEFLNDRRDQGTGGNHNENTLGSVVTYPGVDEIASSAMDPYSGINRNGLMWFDQNTGVATRGFDQVSVTDDTSRSTFQKGGGLGSIALLGVASPVEIGNRVWLDADLNGRQDPDEPAINGAPVQLWTADPPTGRPGVPDRHDQHGDPRRSARHLLLPLRHSRTAGRRLCRTGVPVSLHHQRQLRRASSPPGERPCCDRSGSRGPNAGHRRVRRSDLGRPAAHHRSGARSRPTGHATAAPPPSTTPTPPSSTGRAPVTVGGPGENDHTIDAGWYGVAPFQVEKTVTGTGPPDHDVHGRRCWPRPTSAGTTGSRPPAAIPAGEIRRSPRPATC